MLEFVEKVKEISVKYLDMVKDVELGRAPKPNRESNIPQLPDDYFEFRTIKLNTRVQPARHNHNHWHFRWSMLLIQLEY